MDKADRCKQIKLLALDVDGVLTGGDIYFGSAGELFKQFNSQDGLGIVAARSAGLRVAIITGRTSAIVAGRCAELKVTDVYQGVAAKRQVFEQLMNTYNLKAEEIAYMGDDLNDLPVFAAAGLACAVANAVEEIKERAHYVTERRGGCGAVREVIEMILKTQGKWQQVVDRYLASEMEAGKQ